MVAAAALLLMGLSVAALRWRDARLGHLPSARLSRAERPRTLTH
jgi:hypothetical protein